jgi:hypothetical protein
VGTLISEALLTPFSDRPQLALDLLDEVFGLALPHGEGPHLWRSAGGPRERGAPTGLSLILGRPRRLGIAVEALVARSSHSRAGGLARAAALAARLDAPALLLWVTPGRELSGSRAPPRERGARRFVEVVLGPETMPRVVRAEAARQEPELALLSALIHGPHPGGEAVALAYLEAALLLEERGRRYVDLILGTLPDGARQKLEDVMLKREYQFHSEFARRFAAHGRALGHVVGRAQGREEGVALGKATALIAILDQRALRITRERRAEILACEDHAALDRWLLRAVRAASLDEVLA